MNESASDLRRLEPGPHVSIGRFLDYANWPERERFLELDQKILCSQKRERERQPAQEMSERDRMILALDDQNAPVLEIARMADLTPAGVYCLLKRYGRSRTRRKKP